MGRVSVRGSDASPSVQRALRQITGAVNGSPPWTPRPVARGLASRTAVTEFEPDVRPPQPGQALVASSQTRMSWETFPALLAYGKRIVATTVGDTLLYTVPKGMTLHVTGIVAFCYAQSGAGTNPTISVGITPAAYTDILAATTPALSVQEQAVFLPTIPAAVPIEREVVYLRVNPASTRATWTLNLGLLGVIVRG